MTQYVKSLPGQSFRIPNTPRSKSGAVLGLVLGEYPHTFLCVARGGVRSIPPGGGTYGKTHHAKILISHPQRGNNIRQTQGPVCQNQSRYRVRARYTYADHGCLPLTGTPFRDGVGSLGPAAPTGQLLSHTVTAASVFYVPDSPGQF